MKNRIAVIGGGASGLVAAIAAARAGACVTILEKNPRVGKKLLSTGNGRCNFTNINACAENYNSGFVSRAISLFSPRDAIGFFEEIGLLARIEDEGRVYPASGQAAAVLDVLRLEADRLSVEVRCGFDVREIVRKHDGFIVASESGERRFFDKVIAAAGGMAAPKTGSDGKVFKMLEKLGHTVTELRPSLVQIKTARSIRGVRAHGRVSLENGMSETGEIQFTDYGLSGIPVFALSKYARRGESIFVDLMPEYTHGEVMEILKKRPVQTMETYMIGILNKNLGQMLLKECGISPLSKMSSELAERETEKIADMLKKFRFEITGIMPWDNAQVTSGGISTEEIDPKTMQSKIVKNLYITGELADVDGDCGGYNLHWAWASGFTAGREAAGVQD